MRVADATTRLLEGLVNREILPHLCRPRRDGLDAAMRDPRSLAGLLLDHPDGFRAEVTRREDRGTPWTALAQDLLIPAARGLGLLWEEDLCDFLGVTEAVGRLQSITRSVIGPDGRDGGARPGRSVLLAAAPGETHTYGLCHVAGLFRDAGWATALVDGMGRDDPLSALTAALADGWYDVLGLSLACDVHSDPLRRAMPRIRRSSRNPRLRVILGGALVARGGVEPGMWGVDACIGDPALLAALHAAS